MLDVFYVLQQEHRLLLFFVVFVFGACIGSFLNVVIYRLPIMLKRQWEVEAKEYIAVSQGQPSGACDTEVVKSQRFNLAFPASSCPSCSAAIKPWQNIPILSYILLRGKCANCKSAISIRYPLVELFTGLITLILLMRFGVSNEFLAMMAFSYVSIALTGIDIDEQLLPDVLTLPLLWVGLLINTQNTFVPLQDAVIGAAVGYLSLWAIYWLFKLVTGKEGMGYGDFKLMAVFGSWFGWNLLPNIVLLSSLVGAVLGVGLILVGRQKSQQPLPFGPFIIIAGWLTVMFPSCFLLANYL